ncbi:hydrogenase nickel incorporation protein HypB [Streptomyces sp. NPDC020141]|uniref:hydrogenase nickel incorporation protein HypB n=1 Tax=Streptomyces sp. NPDC020141 TaxID=3365065 RepID=UPI0037A684F4
MCGTADLRQAVLARNDDSARALRAELASRGTVAVNLLSSPGSGKTALLEAELALARERGVPVAALTADLATENDARRLARTGVPVQQVFTDGLCHLEAVMLRGYLAGWLPSGTRVLFVENVGNLVCPASYDLGESLRVTLASVTEGEDKPLKYPGAFGLAQLVMVTKTDIAEAVGFDQDTFVRNVARVNPGVEVVFTSARAGRGVGALLERALAVREGAAAHRPVMSRTADRHSPAHPHPDTHPHPHPHPHPDAHGPDTHVHDPALHEHDHDHDPDVHVHVHGAHPHDHPAVPHAHEPDAVPRAHRHGGPVADHR